MAAILDGDDAGGAASGAINDITPAADIINNMVTDAVAIMRNGVGMVAKL